VTGRAPGRSPWSIDVLAALWLLWAYDAISDLAPLRQRAAAAHGADILRLERSLHAAPELALNRALAPHGTLGLIVSDYYDNAHFLVTLGLVAWLWWRRQDIYRPLRNALVLINVIALIAFWWYPVAPPRMLPGAGFADIVASTHAFGSGPGGQLASHANELSAMPSVHIAWAVWCSVVLWRLSRRHWVRVIAVAYPLVTSVAVMATGNHYLTDLVAGALTAALALAVAYGTPAVAHRGFLSRKARRETMRPEHREERAGWTSPG
jgi:hypothetical protein